MKKGNSLIIKEIVIAIVLSILFSARFVRANPIVIYPVENPYIRIIFLTIFFLIGTAVEYVFFKNYLKKFTTYLDEKNKILSRSIIKINLVTYPITQLFAYIIYLFIIEYFLIIILFLEVGIVFIEWKLIKLELHKIVDRALPSKQILEGTTLANIFSFLIGLIGFIPALI